MASAYSQPLQYTPYQDQYNKELLLKALDYRQNKYDTNRQRIKDAITTTVGIDLIKEEDQEYLYGRLQDVVNVVNQYGSGDLSLDSRADYLTSYISQVADDSVMNGYIGTLKYQNILKGSEKAKEEGTFNQDNFDYSMRDMVNWVNDGKIGSPYEGNSSYVPYTDVNSIMLETIKEMNPDEDVIMTPMGMFTYSKGKYEELSPERIKAAFDLVVASNPGVTTQLKVNAWSQFKDMDDNTFSALHKENFQSQVKQYDDAILSVTKAKLKAPSSEKEIYDQQLKLLNSQKEQLIDKGTDNYDRESLEYLYYKDDLLLKYVDTYTYRKVKDISFETNQGELAMWKAGVDAQLKEYEVNAKTKTETLKNIADLKEKILKARSEGKNDYGRGLYEFLQDQYGQDAAWKDEYGNPLSWDEFLALDALGEGVKGTVPTPQTQFTGIKEIQTRNTATVSDASEEIKKTLKVGLGVDATDELKAAIDDSNFEDLAGIVESLSRGDNSDYNLSTGQISNLLQTVETTMPYYRENVIIQKEIDNYINGEGGVKETVGQWIYDAQNTDKTFLGIPYRNIANSWESTIYMGGDERIVYRDGEFFIRTDKIASSPNAPAAYVDVTLKKIDISEIQDYVADKAVNGAKLEFNIQGRNPIDDVVFDPKETGNQIVNRLESIYGDWFGGITYPVTTDNFSTITALSDFVKVYNAQNPDDPISYGEPNDIISAVENFASGAGTDASAGKPKFTSAPQMQLNPQDRTVVAEINGEDYSLPLLTLKGTTTYELFSRELATLEYQKRTSINQEYTFMEMAQNNQHMKEVPFISAPVNFTGIQNEAGGFANYNVDFLLQYSMQGSKKTITPVVRLTYNDGNVTTYHDHTLGDFSQLSQAEYTLQNFYESLFPNGASKEQKLQSLKWLTEQINN